jgi:hypothetical protein
MDDVYTIIWLGWKVAVGGEKFDRGNIASHPLVRYAESNGYEWYVDTFQEYDDNGEPILILLVGKKMDMIGRKEGYYEISLHSDDLNSFRSTLESLAGVGTSLEDPALWVMMHTEE